MESFNTFEKGMNKDSKEEFSSKNQYYDGKNIRLVSTDNNTNFCIVNINGNEYSGTIPNVYSVWKIEPNYNYTYVSGYTFNIVITDSLGNSYSELVLINSIGYEDLIRTIYNELTTNPTFIPLNLIVQLVNSTTILVYSNDSDIFDIEDSFSSNQYLVNTQISTFQDNLYPIGYGTISDSIILFTTSDSSTQGQIWETTYNYIANELSFRLVYSNALNFSKNYPIEALGVYETDKIQRVYWTDNNNTPRVFNIKSENSLSIDLELITLQPGVLFNKPIIKEIGSGGNIKSGVYQFAYRLTSDDYTTKFSPLSIPINIVEGSEQSAYYFKFDQSPVEYNGTVSNVITNKSVRITIPQVDRKYTNVEVIAIKYATKNLQPEIFIFDTEPITSSDSLEFLYTQTEEAADLTVEQAKLLGIVFDKVKTITTKDNSLFLGNVETKEYADLRLDARAYRFNSVGNTYLSQSGNYWETLDIFDENIPQVDKDAINPYNLDESQRFIYQSDGTTLGGEGKYIKYKFKKVPLNGDTTYYGLTQPDTAPLIDTDRTANEIISLVPDQEYELSNFIKNFKNPFISGLYTGYSRGEVYRFGIVLFDKYGREGLVHWIGDIRFPELYDSDPNDVSEPYFQISNDTNRGGGASHWLYTLGVEFTVDLPNVIKDQISGFSIVRVKREFKDKTKLGIGILNPLDDHNLTTGVSTSAPLARTVGAIPTPSLLNTGQTAIMDNLFMFDSPEFHFNEIDFKEGDYIRLLTVLPTPTNWDTLAGGGPPYRGIIYKYYENIPTTIAPYSFTVNDTKIPLVLSVNVDKGRFFNGSNGAYCFYQYSDYNPAGLSSIGNKTTLIELDGALDIAVDFLQGAGPLDDAGKSLASYERIVLNQYGGNTETDRAKNIYIRCNNFIDVTEDTNFPITFDVFGGDTYVNFYGRTKLERNAFGLNESLYFVGVTTAPPGHVPGPLIGQIYGVESSINLDLRLGYHLLNKHDNAVNDWPNGAGSNFMTFDQETYNSVYSFEDDFVTYVPWQTNTEFTKKYINRIYGSNTKINGEIEDSWRIYSDSYLDVDGIFGPITKILTVNDRLLFFQERGFGAVQVNPVSTVSTLEGETTQLGRGKLLDNYIYISNSSGSINQFGITNSKYGVYYYDNIANKIMMFSDKLEELSFTKGINTFLRNNCTGFILNSDDVFNKVGVVSTYNHLNNEVWFTFKDINIDPNTKQPIYSNFTIVYNELANSFISFIDMDTNLYINNDKVILNSNPEVPKELFSLDKGDKGKYFNTIYDSSISKIINGDNPYTEKVFDNMVIVMDNIDEDKNTTPVNYLKTIRLHNSYQNTGYYNVLNEVNIKRVNRNYHITIPKNGLLPNILTDILNETNIDKTRLFKERMKDRYIVLDLTLNNTPNYELVLYIINMIYRTGKHYEKAT